MNIEQMKGKFEEKQKELLAQIDFSNGIVTARRPTDRSKIWILRNCCRMGHGKCTYEWQCGANEYYLFVGNVKRDGISIQSISNNC